jgi:hypothetical protein
VPLLVSPSSAFYGLHLARRPAIPLLQYREHLENPPLLVICDLGRPKSKRLFIGTVKNVYVLCSAHEGARLPIRRRGDYMSPCDSDRFWVDRKVTSQRTLAHAQ